jgi:hypothetical protein
MTFGSLLRSRPWIWARRLALISIVIFLAFRNYGGRLFSGRAPANGVDVVLTKAEFRADVGNAKPAWIIGLKNQSTTQTYTQVELEAIYMDPSGKTLETDKLVIRQKLIPGAEQVVASPDIKPRPGATAGMLKVLSASK